MAAAAPGTTSHGALQLRAVHGHTDPGIALPTSIQGRRQPLTAFRFVVPLSAAAAAACWDVGYRSNLRRRPSIAIACAAANAQLGSSVQVSDLPLPDELKSLWHNPDAWKESLGGLSGTGSHVYGSAGDAPVPDCFATNAIMQECIAGIRDMFKEMEGEGCAGPVSERMWMVDRLQSLGISRYFEKEIALCLDYVYQHWAGESEGSGVNMQDVGDTALGFRLLRRHGYHVSPDVFLPLKRGQCSSDAQSGQAVQVAGLLNLYKASQQLFPGETVLEQARNFSGTLLDQILRTDDISDRGLLREVESALKYPFHCTLPRINTRAYLHQYATASHDISEGAYRMPARLHNRASFDFLALAKADFNMCQRQHQQELEQLVRWNAEQEFDKLPFARQKVVELFFSIAGMLHEPELSSVRIAWTQSAVIATVLDDYYDLGTPIEELRQFTAALDRWDPALIDGTNFTQTTLFTSFYKSVNAMAARASAIQRRDVSNHVIGHIQKLARSALVEAEWALTRTVPEWEEYMEIAVPSIAIDMACSVACLFAGEWLSDEVLQGEEMRGMADKASFIVRLRNDIPGYKREEAAGKANSVLVHMRDQPQKTEAEVFTYLRHRIDTAFQGLTQQVFRASQIPETCKRVFLGTTTASALFYKDGDNYISMIKAVKQLVQEILFEPVL